MGGDALHNEASCLRGETLLQVADVAREIWQTLKAGRHCTVKWLHCGRGDVMGGESLHHETSCLRGETFLSLADVASGDANGRH